MGLLFPVKALSNASEVQIYDWSVTFFDFGFRKWLRRHAGLGS